MDTVQADTTNTTQSAAAPAVDAPAPAPAPESDVDAFARGVAEASGADAPAPAGEAKTDATQAASPAVPVVPAQEDEDLSDEDRQKAEIEAEVNALGLKEKSAARFRELSARPTQQAFDEISAKAAKADEWQTAIASTGATPDQFGRVMNYLSAINSGDPQKMVLVYDAMLAEMKWLGQRIGKEVPGVFDPLDKHRDLAEEVGKGELTRQRALEIVQQREHAARSSELTQRQQAEFQRQQQFQQANEQAMGDLRAVGARFQASDPAFSQKMAYLQPTLQVIQQTMHPSEWAAAAQRAYLALPSIASAPAPAAGQKPTVGAVPLRPTGATNAQIRQPKDDMEAFSMGVASIR